MTIFSPGRCAAATLLLAAVMVGCAPPPPPETGPPPGWQADGARWWRQGLDTTGVFPNLETLSAMNVTGTAPTYVAGAHLPRRTPDQRQWFERAVKQSLIALYRNDPALIDSLFERYVTPQLQDVSTSDDLRGQVDRYQRKSYKLLRSHFREPRQKLKFGVDFEVPYPDSLRRYVGTVRTQVYIDDEGVPAAIALLDGVHPLLNDIALRATTQMRWVPAYRMRKGRWVEMPAWARFDVKFKGRPAP